MHSFARIVASLASVATCVLAAPAGAAVVRPFTDTGPAADGPVAAASVFAYAPSADVVRIVPRARPALDVDVGTPCSERRIGYRRLQIVEIRYGRLLVNCARSGGDATPFLVDLTSHALRAPGGAPGDRYVQIGRYWLSGIADPNGNRPQTVILEWRTAGASSAAVTTSTGRGCIRRRRTRPPRRG